MSHEQEAIDVIAIGETMLVFRPEGGGLIERSQKFECLTGGAETNCLIGLIRLGLKCAWISKLPDSPLGRRIESEYKGIGVDTSGVVWAHLGRVGLMFIEAGYGPRPNRVYYDRESSAFTTLSESEINWRLIKSSKHLHITGISLALNDRIRSLLGKAASIAKKNGLTVSLDVNHRSGLWSGQEALIGLSKIISSVDLLIISKDEAENIYGIKGAEEDVLRALCERLDVSSIIITLGDQGAAGFWDNNFIKIRALDIEIKNRFGIGDAFTAGVIYGFLKNNIPMGLEYGVVLAALKSTLVDVNMPLLYSDDVHNLVQQIKASDVRLNKIQR